MCCLKLLLKLYMFIVVLHINILLIVIIHTYKFEINQIDIIRLVMLRHKLT